MAASRSASEDELPGCYELDELLYMNPLSSFIADKANMPYVYGLSRDLLIEANSVSGNIQRCAIQYEKTPMGFDDFSSKTDVISESLGSRPDPAQYNEQELSLQASIPSSVPLPEILN